MNHININKNINNINKMKSIYITNTIIQNQDNDLNTDTYTTHNINNIPSQNINLKKKPIFILVISTWD